ncbi:MAG: hypothetical protein N2380_09670 [bacterium]|nr:hypothetical protein [bacterium]
MKQCIGVLLALTIALGTVSLAFAGDGAVKGQFSPEPLWSKDLTLAELLDLTKEQIEEIRAVRTEYLERVRTMRIRLKNKNLSPSYRQKLQDELSGIFEEYWGKVAEILTPVQLAKLVPRRIATILLYDPEDSAIPPNTPEGLLPSGISK